VRRLVALWFLALAAPALADVYTLADGDRISGKTLSLEAGIYKVQTAYGRVAIPRGKVLKIVHDDGQVKGPKIRLHRQRNAGMRN